MACKPCGTWRPGGCRAGAIDSANAALLPRALAAFRTVHPGVRLSVAEGTTPVQLGRLRNGEIDVAVISSNPDQELEGARRTLRAAGVLARFEPVTGPLPASLDATLAWALREGVTNIIRHSDAAHAEVLLSRQEGRARLELMDDGAGCDGCEPGNGLRGLRERVEARGGSLEWGSRPQGGFRLAVSLPLKEAARAAVTA